MSGPTKEDYHSPIYKLATLESELGQARMLLEMPPGLLAANPKK